MCLLTFGYSCRCGVCNGNGTVLDALHECCAGVLDAAGICCPSGTLDDCGVCDGDHSTCLKVIELGIMMPAYASASSLSEPATVSAFRCEHVIGTCMLRVVAIPTARKGSGARLAFAWHIDD